MFTSKMYKLEKVEIKEDRREKPSIKGGTTKNQ